MCPTELSQHSAAWQVLCRHPYTCCRMAAKRRGVDDFLTHRKASQEFQLHESADDAAWCCRGGWVRVTLRSTCPPSIPYPACLVPLSSTPPHPHPISQVPRALADKVKAYYDNVVEREVQADEADIIQGLSASLRTQIVLHLYAEALEKVPFFRWAGTRQSPHRQLVPCD